MTQMNFMSACALTMEELENVNGGVRSHRRNKMVKKTVNWEEW